jgi:uncharacterized protein YlxP (DUF503 family)
MVLGVMQVEIAIDWSQSLKDKRRVVKSLRDTLHRHHMVSVSEVEDHEILNRATLGIAIVGVSGGAIGVTLDRVLERIRSTPDCELTGTSREILQGWDASFSTAGSGQDDFGDLASTLERRANEELGRDIA